MLSLMRGFGKIFSSMVKPGMIAAATEAVMPVSMKWRREFFMLNNVWLV